MDKLDTLYYKVFGKQYLDFSDKTDAELIDIYRLVKNFVITRSNNDRSVFDIRLKNGITFSTIEEQTAISEDKFLILTAEIISRKLTTSQLYK